MKNNDGVYRDKKHMPDRIGVLVKWLPIIIISLILCAIISTWIYNRVKPDKNHTDETSINTLISIDNMEAKIGSLESLKRRNNSDHSSINFRELSTGSISMRYAKVEHMWHATDGDSTKLTFNEHVGYDTTNISNVPVTQKEVNQLIDRRIAEWKIAIAEKKQLFNKYMEK